MYASGAGQLRVVKYLVQECKADINARDKVKQRTESNKPCWSVLVAELCALQEKMTPLMHASAVGEWDVVKYLVEECKADVNVRDEVNQHTESNRLLVN